VRRLFSTLLALTILGGVAGIVWAGRRADGGDTGDLTTLHGVIGSEKTAFFADPAVTAAFAARGLRLTVDPVGSRRIAELDLAGYDFAFPSSAPAAEKIQRNRQVTRTYAPFYSPMAIATFKSIAHLLVSQKITRISPQGYWEFDVAAYLAAAEKGLRWDAIPNNTEYPARRNVLVTTTHPRDSNSAAMYAAVMSYVLNGENVVRDQAQLGAVQPRVSRLFLDQGYLEGSTEAPWEKYLANGLNSAPLVWVYEAQFLGRQLNDDKAIRDTMVLAYPTPTVLSKHTLVPLSGNGDRVGRLLAEDPELQRLAARHGFRTNGFEQAVAEKKLIAPTTLPGVVDPPAFEIQEAMLDAISGQYKN
jgi:hypothetical protein